MDEYRRRFPAKGGDRRIYISRARAGRRRLQNEDELWRELKARGWERVFTEDLTFTDQVALFGSCSAVLGLHGAGLANLVFCPQNAVISEVVPRNCPEPYFMFIARRLGFEYQPFWGVEPKGIRLGRLPIKDYGADAVAPVSEIVRYFDALDMSVDPPSGRDIGGASTSPVNGDRVQ